MSDIGNVVDVDAEVKEKSPPVEPVPPDASAPPATQPPISAEPDDPKLSDAPSVPGAPSASDPAPAGDPEPLPPFKECYDALDSAQAKGFKDTIEALRGVLDRKCPGLAPVLRSSEVTTTLGTYELQDGIAKKQQADLKREALIAYVCLLAAGVTSGLILTVSKYVSPWEVLGVSLPDPAKVVLWLGILTLALGAAAALFEYIARDQGRLNRWQTSRGAAEVARLNVFSIIAARAAKKGRQEALYGLAIVVRDLLDDQRTWLSGRAEDHRKSSFTTSLWGGLASALAFIGGSGAIIASQVPDTAPVVLAGVVGAAVGAFATNRESLNRDRANADRYEKTRIALDGIRGRTDDVVDTIWADQKEAVVAFTQTVTDLLAAEHKQWLEGAAQAEAALGKLDEQLAGLKGDAQTPLGASQPKS